MVKTKNVSNAHFALLEDSFRRVIASPREIDTVYSINKVFMLWNMKNFSFLVYGAFAFCYMHSNHYFRPIPRNQGILCRNVSRLRGKKQFC